MTCPTPDKRPYPGLRVAEKAAVALARRAGTILFAYKCGDHWHLSRRLGRVGGRR
jgi:hypothetical protein